MRDLIGWIVTCWPDVRLAWALWRGFKVRRKSWGVDE